MARRRNRQEMVCADAVAAVFSVDAHRSLAGIRPSEDLGAIASKTATFFAVSHGAMALDARGRYPPHYDPVMHCKTVRTLKSVMWPVHETLSN